MTTLMKIITTNIGSLLKKSLRSYSLRALTRAVFCEWPVVMAESWAVISWRLPSTDSALPAVTLSLSTSNSHA